MAVEFACLSGTGIFLKAFIYRSEEKMENFIHVVDLMANIE
jgi:hypothetical protein